MQTTGFFTTRGFTGNVGVSKDAAGLLSVSYFSFSEFVGGVRLIEEYYAVGSIINTIHSSMISAIGFLETTTGWKPVNISFYASRATGKMLCSLTIRDFYNPADIYFAESNLPVTSGNLQISA